MKREKFVSHGGKELSLCVWDAVAGEPRGIVQIAHGMAEHAARYNAFAEYLNANGFYAAANDHRAHGYTAPEALGKAEQNGDIFSDTVSDLAALTARLKSRWKGLPLTLLGHSYGSFLAQGLLARGAENIDALILSGSAFMKGFTLNFGAKLAAGRVRKNRGGEDGETFYNLTFKKYDKAAADGVCGWLSRDFKEVGKYNLDPFCGFVCSNGFYASFFNGLKDIAASDLSLAPKTLKILIASGGRDPVGEYGKSVIKLYERLRRCGLKPLLKIYDGARHEILNETNRAEVYADFLEFITV
jgi:alpha-beta hydrolase superfamily lysophospholipase